MRKPSRHLHPVDPDAEPIVYTDDGGSGLLEACKARFEAPEFIVECDSRHTVWVKRADGSRSFGCPPWLLRQRSVEEVLETVEVKLRLPVSPTR